MALRYLKMRLANDHEKDSNNRFNFNVHVCIGYFVMKNIINQEIKDALASATGALEFFTDKMENRLLDEYDDCDIDYEVTSKTDPVEAKIWGLPENCYPAEGGEVEYDIYIFGLLVDCFLVDCSILKTIDDEVLKEVFT